MKRIVAVAVSVALLIILVWHVDAQALLRNLRATRWGLFALALALFVPQTLVIAWRWKRLTAPFTALPLAESTRMILAGATMNLVLPGKLGDLTKAWFMVQNGRVSLPLAVGIVVFEKMLDVATLALFMLMGTAALLLTTHNDLPVPLPGLAMAAGLGLAAVIGVALLYFVPLSRLPGYEKLRERAAASPALARVHQLLTGSQNTMATLQSRGANRAEIITLSLAIWVLHLGQIALFFLSLNAHVTLAQFFTAVPLAIFIGLIPISVAGFGTRDAALVTLLPTLPASLVLAAAFYINLRYIVPALAGIPFLARYAALRKKS